MMTYSERQANKFKHHWLVQYIENGDVYDIEMFNPDEREKAVECVNSLFQKDGIKGIIVHPSIESFEKHL